MQIEEVKSQIRYRIAKLEHELEALQKALNALENLPPAAVPQPPPTTIPQHPPYNPWGTPYPWEQPNHPWTKTGPPNDPPVTLS